ncbi:MAG: hypothetical protein SVO26_03080 [Chloroflexota bacterium]|nr:hypothetical protein [Chloroflexota bacterium]
MAKKSRKTAVKYSELSKSGKKRQPNRPSVPPSVPTRVVSTSETEKVVRPVRTRQVEPKKKLPSYQYVRLDLRRIGILAGVMVIILILLSFVLG